MSELEKLALDEAIILKRVYRADSLQAIYRQRLNYHLMVATLV